MHLAARSLSSTVTTETMSFARSALDGSGSVFFWIEPNFTVLDYESYGLSDGSWISHYRAEYEVCDPLNTQKLLYEQRQFAIFSVEKSRVQTANVQKYEEFQHRYNIVDEVLFAFWQDGEPLAGMSVLKMSNDPMRSAWSEDMAAMAQYFGHVIRMHPVAQQRRLNAALARNYHLTRRVIEIVELIRVGATNSDIAEALCISIGTVKGYVFSVFNKLGLDSRSAVTAFCSLN